MAQCLYVWLLSASTLLLVCIHSSTPCYIGLANCLFKRSGPHVTDDNGSNTNSNNNNNHNNRDSLILKQLFGSKHQVQRECPKCGPSGEGVCYGPSICCGDFGCIMSENSVYLDSCQMESLLSHHCTISAPVCASGQGRCAPNGYCCTSRGCQKDDYECLAEDN